MLRVGAPSSDLWRAWIEGEKQALAGGKLCADDADATAKAIDSMSGLADRELRYDEGMAVVLLGTEAAGVATYGTDWLGFVFVARAFRGSGVALRAAGAAVRMGFERGTHSVGCRPDSVAGRGLAGRLGFIDTEDSWTLSNARWEITRHHIARSPALLPELVGRTPRELFLNETDRDPVLGGPTGPMRVALHRDSRAFGYFESARRWYWLAV